MQFCLIFNNFYDQYIVDLLNPVCLMRSNCTEPLKELPLWSLEIDRQILDHCKKVDWLLYCTGPDLRLENFYKNVELGYTQRTIYSVNDNIDLLSQNFYCTAETFSYFGSHYKLSTPNIVNNLTNQTKLFYMAMRTNLEIVNL
jgi:hypothetical protein